MDSHKSLYKDHRFHTSRQHNKYNRELQEANRIKQRRDRYQVSRNISPSPVRCIQETNPCSGDKETPTEINIKNSPNSTRLAKIACNASNSEKLTKLEAYIKRFVEWREKQNLKKSLTIKQKPFLSAVNSSRQTTSSTCLVPRGHHKGFRAPDGLKTATAKVSETKDVTKKRQSTYILVPTPPRKQIDKKCAKQNSLGKSFHAKTPHNTKRMQRTATTNKFNIKTPQFKKSLIRKSPTASSAKASVDMAMALGKGHTETTKNSSQQSLRKGPKLRELKIPPPPPPSTRPTGAIPKAKKQAEVVKRTKKSPLKVCDARFSQNLKAKKTNAKKVNISALQIKMVNILKSNQMADDTVIKTPRDFATLNPFEEFITSTKLKSTSHMENMDNKNLKKVSHKKSHCTSLAKRNIMEKSINSDKNNEENSLQSVIKKHNFIRYSEATDEIVNDRNNKDAQKNEDKIKVLPGGGNEHTPIKLGPEERPANYMSPFVSVSRGKVSFKKEKEKRNSIYLQNFESNDLPKESSSQNTSLKYSVEDRRTLEAVRYFRKQLQDEIDRLHNLCNIWEAYKKDNLEIIQNANGEDMINVTVGQTRLLTSKKFMQFKGLIDRCEAGATGNGAVEYNGSEGTKPITSGDLEGFWSMLGIQIDNLEKRFDNLNRWKMNEWKDPDEEKPKIKKNLTKVKKAKSNLTAKAKPNSALQEMLRKMQAEMRKNKSKTNDLNEVVVLTSSKTDQQRSESYRKSINASSPRRLSIVVKDRKYFSPAATVISILSPNRKISKYLQDSPGSTKHLQSSLELRKSILINENSRRMSLIPKLPTTDNKNNDCKNSLDYNKENLDFSEERGVTTSPVPTGRKSILKTPGTAKSRLRNVIFNERLRVKKFNFLINETGEQFNTESCEESHEDLVKNSEEIQNKDTPLRTLTLRTRKVRLRPSCEIIIPKK